MLTSCLSKSASNLANILGDRTQQKFVSEVSPEVNMSKTSFPVSWYPFWTCWIKDGQIIWFSKLSVNFDIRWQLRGWHKKTHNSFPNEISSCFVTCFVILTYFAYNHVNFSRIYSIIVANIIFDRTTSSCTNIFLWRMI